MGCTTVLGTLHFSAKGDERFYRSILMPAVMRVLDPERSHTFAVWLASKDLVPMDRTGDPEILVNENLKQHKSRLVISKLCLGDILSLLFPEPEPLLEQKGTCPRLF